MITIICGLPGVGKTALMTYFAILRMQHPREYLKKSSRLVEKFKQGGFNFLELPCDHLTYSDYTISTRKNGLGHYINSHYVNGFRLGLENKEKYQVVHLAPFSSIFLDEAQKYFNSRMSLYFSDFVSRYFETHRHNNLDIYLACQRLGLIDLNIRELAEKVIIVKEIKFKYNGFNIVKTIWDCLEFEDCKSAMSYLENSNFVNGKQVRFKYNGNIFKSYDSFEFMPLHYKNMEFRNFDFPVSVPTNKNVVDFEKFNNEHDFECPVGYYSKRGK